MTGFRPRARLAGAAASLLALTLAAPGAGAYNVTIHSLLDERAVPAAIASQPVAPFTIDDVNALRVAIHGAGAAHPDPAVRERFRRRYPTAAGFDAWAFKEFLALNPEANVFGIDRLPGPRSPLTVGALLALGSRQPDDDRRNQSRFAHDVARRVRRDPFGQPLPADPAQLHMGALTGTSSQAHAHYGLPRLEFSESPDVLKKEPRRFAYPKTARAFAADFVQLHTDLAICASTLGRGGGPALGWLLLGHAHHYLQDVANQIHTLQAIYAFFRDARIGQYLEELKSMGGLFRSRPDFVTIGIGIVKNHHLLAESLFARRVSEWIGGQVTHPEVGRALVAIGEGDGALERALDARAIGVDEPFGRIITAEVIEASSREGGEVYELIRRLAREELSGWGTDYEDGMDPDRFLRSPPDARALERFYRLQAAGFARAGSALRRHARLYVAAIDAAEQDDAARRARFLSSARRLVATQLDYLDARDARLAGYQPRPPREEAINWWVPGGTLALLGLALWLPIGWVRRRRRTRRAGT